MTGPQCIHHDNIQVRPDKRKVIITPVPQNDIRFTGRFIEDALVVDTRVNRYTHIDVRFVFLTLLDRAFMSLQVRCCLKTLDPLHLEVTVGHGVANHGYVFTLVRQQPRQPLGQGTLASAGTCGRNAHYGFRRNELRLVRAQHHETRPGRLHHAGLVHQFCVRDVAVSEENKIYIEALDQTR